MNKHDIIIKPVISEKSMDQLADRKYTFIVAKDANKIEIAKAVEDAGADAISLINTMLGMRFNMYTGQPIISIKKGGYSGPGVYPVALRMVYEVSHAVNIPIIGMGGVSKAEDVIEMMYAGATLVMVGSQNLVDPYACKKIIDDLEVVMKKYKIKDLKDIIGKAK